MGTNHKRCVDAILAILSDQYRLVTPCGAEDLVLERRMRKETSDEYKEHVEYVAFIERWEPFMQLPNDGEHGDSYRQLATYLLTAALADVVL
jgi:hypothetical protein